MSVTAFVQSGIWNY